MAGTVLEIVCHHLGWITGETGIDPDRTLEQNGVDSLDMLEADFTITGELGIKSADQDYPKDWPSLTPRQIADHYRRLLRKRAAAS